MELRQNATLDATIGDAVPARAGDVPVLDAGLVPPLIHGTAALAHKAFAGAKLETILGVVNRPAATQESLSALNLDRGVAHQLGFQPLPAQALQERALQLGRMFRVADIFGTQSERPLRVLALLAPGDLMINTPLDFITAHLDVRLDLLFVVPGQKLPARVPDHDVAFFAVSESDPATLRRLAPLFKAWPRPVLNDPAAVALLSRDQVSRSLAGATGLLCPVVRRASRADLALQLADGEELAGTRLRQAGTALPLVIRPVGSHGGQLLYKADSAAALAAYLDVVDSPAFFVAPFVDYRDADGMYRKYRVAVIEGAPFLCHMAVSPHWMVHYLNADMAGQEDRRREEARAMETFDRDFAARHGEAFRALRERIGLDYFQIDCAELPDGRLLVFEADVAAIVHAMDPPDPFDYKPTQMRLVFDAFGAMLRRAATPPRPRDAAWPRAGGGGTRRPSSPSAARRVAA